MKNIFTLLFHISFNSFLIGQFADFQSTEGSSQIRLISNDGAEFFGLRMNNDGVLRIMANNADEVLTIEDDTENVTVGVGPTPTVRFYSVNNSPADETRYAIYGWSRGVSNSARYGLFGYASETSGNRYGVYGWTATGNGRWGVYCAGNMWYTGSLTSTSDRKFKSNIRDLSSGLAAVLQLRPRSYSFKSDLTEKYALSEGTQHGFVAQELEKVLPDLVKTDLHDVPSPPGIESNEKIEVKGINYIGLIPVLNKALQEQQAIIESLEERIRKLESEK